jgi:tetratricopeptide (TPR) repeat protein
VELAVDAFVASEQAFEEVEDNQYKALLYNHYGSLLVKQGVYEEALRYYKESYRYKLLGDSLHYVVSACGQIANIYEMINMPDSAVTYFELGLSYADKLNNEKRGCYYLLLHDYAAFWMSCKNYTEAERLFQDCIGNLKNSEYSYTLYSALTTLYYEKKELEKALFYGQQILGSDDSLTVCGGYLRLYKIYKGMGEMDSAYHYHNLYRQYNSDITMRMKTAEVAAIPHKMKVAQLANENSALAGWRMWLIVALLVITALWWGIYRTIRCRHRREQHAKEQELAVKSEELESVGNKYGKTSAELGRLKGALTNHVDAINRMKKEHQAILEKHRTEIEEQKRSVKELKEEIRDLKKADRATLRTENELKRTLHHLEKELDKRTDQLSEAEHQHEIDRRIEHFMASGECKRAVDMLLTLRLKRKVDARYDIGREEYHYLMMQLMEQENPALYAQLEQCGLDKKKRTLCCMIALGLDDIDMMAEAVCLSPYTVKEYYKDCEEVVEGCRD